MRYSKISSELFKTNRKKLVKNLQTNSLVIVQANDQMPRNGDTLFKYRQNSDMFYLTGLDQEDTILLICPDFPDEKYREIVFTTQTNDELRTWHGHKYTKVEAREISGVQTVLWRSQFDTVLRNLMLHSEYVYLNLNEYIKFDTPVNYRDWRFVTQLQDKFPLHQYRRLAPLLAAMRVRKEPQEIELIEKAVDLTKDAFYRVLKMVRPSVKEYEIEAEMTHEFIRRGANGHAYHPIIASGADACVLHYEKNDKACADGELLLMDFGAEYANYAADCSRTIPVNGRFTSRQKELYAATLRVLKQAQDLLIPGISINEINEKVGKMWEEEHIKLGLYTKEDVQNNKGENPLWKTYYPHGTSHFMGLDVHDTGSLYTPLEKGMVLTCEPGIYIRKEGIGIRLENDILVDDQPINLTQDIPIEIDEIETLMTK